MKNFLPNSNKALYQYIILIGILLFIYNMKNSDVKNNYVLSVIADNTKDLYENTKGVLLDIYNDGKKTLFIPAKKGLRDKLLVFSKKMKSLVNIADKTTLSSLNKTYGCISIDLDKDGYSDLIVSRDDGVTLYKNIKGTGQFKSIKLLGGFVDGKKPIGLILSDNGNILHTSDYKFIKNNSNSEMYNIFVDNKGNHKLLNITNQNLSNHLQQKNPIPYNPDQNIKYFEQFNPVKNNILDINGPVNIKNNKIINYFGVDLPNNNEFIGSKVIVKSGDKILNQVFNGYLIKFNLDNPIIDSVHIITPNNKKYSGYKKNINSVFTIIPLKNINEKEHKIVSYYLGDRSGKETNINTNSCVHKLDYRPLNNLDNNYGLNVKSRRPIISLMNHTPEQYSETYMASYDMGARGQNYYNVDVNQYKAPIYIGKSTNEWKNQPCIKNLEYKKLNNIDTNYGINTGKSNKGEKINLLLPPTNYSDKISYVNNKRGGTNFTQKNDCVLNKIYNKHNNIVDNNNIIENKKSNKINLIKPPNKTNQYSVSYHSMNRVQNNF